MTNLTALDDLDFRSSYIGYYNVLVNLIETRIELFGNNTISCAALDVLAAILGDNLVSRPNS